MQYLNFFATPTFILNKRESLGPPQLLLKGSVSVPNLLDICFQNIFIKKSKFLATPTFYGRVFSNEIFNVFLFFFSDHPTTEPTAATFEQIKR